MKKFSLFLILIIVVAGFITCEETDNPPPGKDVCAITFNANGGGGGQTTPVSAVYGQPMPPLDGQVPTKENYSNPNDGYANNYEKYYFDGYYDAASGGTKYYNADLTSAKNWDKGADTTLFAHWLTSAQKYNLGQDDFVAYFTDTPPAIDGNGNDPCWARAKWQNINYAWMYQSPRSLSGTLNANGTVSKTADFSGRFKVLWTADRLYILAEIIDDIKYCPATTPTQSPEKNDCLEIFIDENASGGVRTSDGGNNFFTYHMNFDGVNVADWTGSQNVLRNSHLKYKINDADAPKYIWETEMKVYNSSYPLNTTPSPDPAGTLVTLTEGKKIGFAVAYCDNDNNAHSSISSQIGDRDHFIGSMFVTGSTDEQRNVSYKDSTQYAKLYLVQ
jgi:hypothetical protein